VLDVNVEVLQQLLQDRLVWQADEEDIYLGKSAYEVLHYSINTEYILTLEALWEIKAIPNILLLAWRILKGKVSTRAKLIRRGVILPTTLCPLCNESL